MSNKPNLGFLFYKFMKYKAFQEKNKKSIFKLIIVIFDFFLKIYIRIFIIMSYFPS